MEKTMKAARLYELGKPLVIEEVPIPELSDDDVLVALPEPWAQALCCCL